MSRLYPNEQTIKPIVEPPPYSAEITQTQLHVQQLPVLKDLTFHRIPESLICFAIDQGKKDQLVRTTREALKINFGIDDYYLNEVLAKRRTLPDNGNILQEGSEIGHYLIHTVQWTRGRFRVQPRTIIYGNCPRCFKAMPRGQSCHPDHCDEMSASDLYFVHDTTVYHNPNIYLHDGPPEVLTNGRNKAEPRLLSRLVRQQPVVFLDWDSYESKNLIYEPENPRHWCCLSVKHVLVEVNRYMLYDTYGTDPEGTVIRATQATRRDVEYVFDQNHQMFSPNARANIRMARRVYDRNHSIRRRHNPFENDAEMASWYL